MIKDCVKSAVEQHIGTSIQADGGNLLNDTAKNKIQSISTTQFYSLMESVFASLSNLIIQTKQIREVIHQHCAETSTLHFLRQEMDKALETCCEVGQSRASTLLSTRDEDVKKMSKDDILTYMKLPQEFINKCEQVLSNSKRINVLRTTMTSQGQLFLEEFDKTRISNLNLLLHNESWKPAPQIPVQFQLYVDEFAPTDMTRYDQNAEGKKTFAYLMIQNTNFLVCQTMLNLVSMINEYYEWFGPQYQHFITPIDIGNKLFNLVSTFNTRMNRLVLGAGALNSAANLRSITGKHLLLSSECANFLLHFVPFLKEAVLKRSNLQQQQMLTRQLDSFVHDCSEHRRKIFDQLTAIMSDTIDSVVDKAIHQFKWNDVKDEDPTPLTELIKNLNFLQSAAVQFLESHPEDLSLFFGKIIKMCFDKLPSCLRTLNKSGSIHAKGKAAVRKGVVKLETSITKWTAQCHINNVDFSVIEDAIKS
ncbi:Vps54 [Acrasis kona]|uniref:Vps54 n=1 Tax=Acrasis kona TaxID=1008807 RepID=A0AAW2Z026_9EUKA